MSGNRPFDLSEPTAAALGDDAAPTPKQDVDSMPAAPAAPETAAAPAAVESNPGDLLRAAPAPRGWPIYAAAAGLSLAVVAVVLAYALAEPGRLAAVERSPVQMGELALVALAALGFVWVAAFLAQQGRRLAAEAGQARTLAEGLLAPAALAAQETGRTVAAVRTEIERASAAAVEAQAGLSALREALAADSAQLTQAAQDSSRAAAALTDGLADEAKRLEELATTLEARARGMSEAIAAQAHMVAEASDLAQTQISEAEAALAARAADLAAAAGEAGDAARLATATLSGQIERLEIVNASTGEQARAIEESMAEQRAGLVAAAHGMRADHETYAAHAESLRAQFVGVAEQARAGAGELNQSVAQSADALRQMVDATSEQLRELARTAGEERDRQSAQSAQTLATISESAARERDATEAKAREMLGLLAVAAAESKERADAVFVARLAEARQMIEQSTALVDQAGVRITERLAAGADAARIALAALEAELREVDQRLARAPADTEAQTTAIRQNVERGIEALMESARRAAEETRNIDAAFQDRVRRNYDMLSEAVRLMGVVAGANSSTGQRAPVRPAAPPPTAQAPAARVPTPAQASAPAQAPAPVAVRPEPARPADPALRPRLKLTPTATDAEFKTVFEAAGGREPAETIGDSWTWKELLSSMDKPEADEASVMVKILGEVEAMGIDAGALVPRPRVEEIVGVQRAGDPAGARDIVRRLAPAAVRRLSRRLMTDPPFREQAEAYVRRYAELLNEAATRQDGDRALSGLLGSDQGRAYLLLDAAIIDAR
jgi:hypothetical protein